LLKHGKTKIYTVFLVATTFLLVSTPFYSVPYITWGEGEEEGGGSHVIFDAGGSLGFQNDLEHEVVLNVTSGALNSTENTISLDKGGGYFMFTALDDTVILLDYTVDDVKVEGDQNQTSRIVQSGDSFTVDTGDTVLISWAISYAPLLPLMFIIGMIGLGAFIGGPVYGVMKFKEHDYYNGFVVSLAVTAVGLALVIGWLWC